MPRLRLNGLTLSSDELVRIWPTAYAGEVERIARMRPVPMSTWCSFGFYDELWESWAQELGMTWMVTSADLPSVVSMPDLLDWVSANGILNPPAAFRHFGISPEHDGTLWYDEISSLVHTDPAVTFNGQIHWAARAPLKAQLRAPVPPSWYRVGSGILARGGKG